MGGTAPWRRAGSPTAAVAARQAPAVAEHADELLTYSGVPSARSRIRARRAAGICRARGEACQQLPRGVRRQWLQADHVVAGFPGADGRTPCS